MEEVVSVLGNILLCDAETGSGRKKAHPASTPPSASDSSWSLSVVASSAGYVSSYHTLLCFRHSAYPPREPFPTACIQRSNEKVLLFPTTVCSERHRWFKCFLQFYWEISTYTNIHSVKAYKTNEKRRHKYNKYNLFLNIGYLCNSQ